MTNNNTAIMSRNEKYLVEAKKYIESQSSVKEAVENLVAIGYLNKDGSVKKNIVSNPMCVRKVQ